ncbi:PepSY-associated TM helix domain-containing protein [Pararhodospirillum photometricum]|nr:PepSY-associated TM helix domain-containing protein [Pararhodospirillum photometricum]
MALDIVRAYRTVHTWTGILTGLALFIAFFAGALTVFKDPLTRWASPPTARPPLVLEQGPSLVARTLAAAPAAAAEFTLHLGKGEAVPGPLEWRVTPGAAPGDEPPHDSLGQRHYVAHLDEAGSLKIEEVAPSKLAEFIDVLHRVVGLPVDTDLSRWIMGVVAGLYALALLSGVILILPTLVRDLFALRPEGPIRRFWRDSHNLVGLLSLPFHLVMALTATVFAFHDQIYDLQDALIHDGRLAALWHPPAPPLSDLRPLDPARLHPPADLVAQARGLSPSFEPTHLQYLGLTGPRPVVRVWGQDPQGIASRALGGFVAFNPYSGAVLTTEYLPGHQSAAQTTISSFFALHFGSYGGTPVKVMTFVLGLAGAWLFYSGNLLWIEARRKRQGRDVRILANLTVGVCLGCLCGIAATMGAAKWLQGGGRISPSGMRVFITRCFLGAWPGRFGGAPSGPVVICWGWALFWRRRCL